LIIREDIMKEKIYDKLRRKILFLKFQPGETMDEKKLQH
jgi:DNA-binding GntR family transcriptional regulator